MVERIEQKQQEVLDQKLKLDILNWLSPLQMTQVHQTISDRVVAGSGRWFLNAEEFRDWQCGREGNLWCSGIPGAGKTIITSIAMDFLRGQQNEMKEKKIGIAVLYLKYNDPEQTLDNLMSSLLRQLAQEHEVVPQPLRDLYEHHRDRNTSPSLHDIIEALYALVKTYNGVFILVDALDECSEETRWGLLEKLRGMESNIHLMITSRFLDSINEELEEFSRLEIKANKADVELFIDHQIRKNRNLRRIVEKSPTLRDDIKEEVVKTAEDMFLLARLHVESLASAAALSIKHVRRKLQTLPTTLAGTYDEAMQRIERQEPDHRDVALKSLAWVSYAFRSLSLKELQHALVIEPGDTDLDEELMIDGNSITALCAGLVVIDQRTNVVNLVHYTMKNYFEDVRQSRFPGFHANITMSCATYLTLTPLKEATIWEILRKFPLAYYAAQYMGAHARQNPEDALESSTLEVLCRLLSHPDRRRPLLSLLDGLYLIKSGFYTSKKSMSGFQSDTATEEALEQGVGSLFNVMSELHCGSAEISVQRLQDEVDEDDEDDENKCDSGDIQAKANRIPEVTALHLAASMGLAKVASMLLKETPNIDAVDETGKTALAVAMEKGFEKAVEFLVNSGACVDLEHDHGRAVLLLVTERNWHNVVQIIAQKSELSTTTGETIHVRDQVQLLLAAYDGNSEEARRLLAQGGIDLEFGDRIYGATALFIAVECNHAEMVQILLDAGVDVNSKDSMGQTSLHRATRRESIVLMRLLLKNGAEVDLQNDDGRTAWSANARTCNESLLRILLEAGANPSTKGHNGISELFQASASGESTYVKFLLRSGTDPSIKTMFGWAPLHWAANNGHIDCVELLIQAGADPSPLSDQDSTPLDLALRANQTVIADVLVRAGAKEGRDILTKDFDLPSAETFGEANNMEGTAIPNSPLLEQTDNALNQGKLSLTFDEPLGQGLLFGQFIYPSNSTATAHHTYHISHFLDISTSSMGIRRARHRVNMAEYPLGPESYDSQDSLYDITTLSLDYQELELRGRTQNPLPGVIKMYRGWTGGWKIHHELNGSTSLLFRTAPDWSKFREDGCRWTTKDGELLARTGWEGAKTPVLCLEQGLESQMQDVLVSCWIGKLWSDIVTLQTRGGGHFSPAGDED